MKRCLHRKWRYPEWSIDYEYSFTTVGTQFLQMSRHSMTPSARASSVGGTSSPSAYSMTSRQYDYIASLDFVGRVIAVARTLTRT